jgi:hypothetical protein
MKIMIRIKLFFKNLFKHRVCDICGHEMTYFSHGGLDFWLCDHCDNIDDKTFKKRY